MPEISLGDFSKVGAIPPEGYYRVQIPKNAEVKPNKSKDGHNVCFTTLIIDPPAGAEDFENFSIPHWLSMKVSARWKLKEALEAITQHEWAEEDTKLVTDDDDVTLIDPAFEDVTVMVQLKHGLDQNNKQQAQVQTWLPDDGETEPQIFASEESDEEPF